MCAVFPHGHCIPMLFLTDVHGWQHSGERTSACDETEISNRPTLPALENIIHSLLTHIYWIHLNVQAALHYFFLSMPPCALTVRPSLHQPIRLMGQSFIYSTTDALVSCLKKNSIKIYIKTLMKRYSPSGRRNHGRPLKRLLDTWDRNGLTSGPTPWQIYDDDDD